MSKTGRVVRISRNKDMYKIGVDEVSSIWYFLTEAVQAYAATINVVVGDTVTFDSNLEGGKNVIAKVNKGAATGTSSGGGTSTYTCESCGASLKDSKYKKCYTCNQKAKGGGATESNTTSTGFVCEECGATLKDNKYKKCYTCNQKNRSSDPATGAKKYYTPRTPQERREIRACAIGHMVSRTMISLQGHVDPNNVAGLVSQLYAEYESLVIEPTE